MLDKKLPIFYDVRKFWWKQKIIEINQKIQKKVQKKQKKVGLKSN